MKKREIFEHVARTDAVRKNLRRRSVRGALFMASGQGLELVLRVVSVAILARILLPEHFGLVAMVTAVTGIAEGIRDLGLSTATVQRPDISHQQISNLFWVNGAAGVLFTLLFCALSWSIATFYDDYRLVGVTIVVSTTFLFSGFSAQHEALMSRQLRQGELAFIRLVANFLSIVVAVVLAARGWGYWALVWREVLSRAFISMGLWVQCPWMPSLPSRTAGTLGLLRFGRDLTLTHLLTSLIANVDRLLIGRFYGPDSVGLYRQSQQLLVVPIDQLNGPIQAVAQPGLSALQGEADRYRRYYEKIVFLVALATFPLGMFVAVYAEEVTLLILGPVWSDASVFVRIFGLAAAIRPAIATSAVVLITSGRSVRYLAIATVHSIVLVTFLLFGVQWGAEGVAVAHVLTTVALMIPKLHYSFLGTPITLAVFGGAVRTPLLAGVAMVAGLLIFRSAVPVSGNLLSLLVGAGVGGALYAAVWLVQGKGRRQFRSLTHDLGSALQGGMLR